MTRQLGTLTVHPQREDPHVLKFKYLDFSVTWNIPMPQDESEVQQQPFLHSEEFEDNSKNKWQLKFYYRNENPNDVDSFKPRAELCHTGPWLGPFADPICTVTVLLVLSPSGPKSVRELMLLNDCQRELPTAANKVGERFLKHFHRSVLTGLKGINLYCRIHFSRSDKMSLVANSKILLDMSFTDVTISVGDRSFPAHKVILAAQSPVFHAMFTAEMTEAKNGHVVVPGISPSLFQQLLHYIYNNTCTSIDLEFGADWLRVADMYQLDGLKNYLEKVFGENITVENAVELYDAAFLHRLDKLKQATVDFIKANYEAVSHTEIMKEYPKTNPEGMLELFTAVLHGDSAKRGTSENPEETSSAKRLKA